MLRLGRVKYLERQLHSWVCRIQCQADKGVHVDSYFMHLPEPVSTPSLLLLPISLFLQFLYFPECSSVSLSQPLIVYRYLASPNRYTAVDSCLSLWTQEWASQARHSAVCALLSSCLHSGLDLKPSPCCHDLPRSPCCYIEGLCPSLRLGLFLSPSNGSNFAGSREGESGGALRLPPREGCLPIFMCSRALVTQMVWML